MTGRDKMDGETRRNRRAQLLLFSGLAALALLALAFWLLASGGKAPRPGARIEAELAGPGTAEESWTRRSELRLGVIETRLSEMEAENRRLAGENRKLGRGSPETPRMPGPSSTGRSRSSRITNGRWKGRRPSPAAPKRTGSPGTTPSLRRVRPAPFPIWKNRCRMVSRCCRRL